MRATDPAVTFCIIVMIGIVAGSIFDRVAGPSWLTRQFAGSTRGIVTSSLIGIAGAFVGFHLSRPLWTVARPPRTRDRRGTRRRRGAVAVADGTVSSNADTKDGLIIRKKPADYSGLSPAVPLLFPSPVPSSPVTVGRFPI